MPTIVVGKNSFLAQGLEGNPACKDWVFLSHKESLENPKRLAAADTLINFAFDSSLMTGDYEEGKDIDAKLARIISPSKTHYIMLSSRMVYGDAKNIVLHETDEPEPQSFYGRAKLTTEKLLPSIIDQDRLTVLRLSNIFGFELGRKTFFGHALTNLKTKNQITFDISLMSVRDFMARDHFQSALITIAAARKPGLFNVGSGYPTTCHDITNWLVEGYGQGEIISTGDSKKGEFWLDMTKSRATFNLPPVSIETLRDDCIRCGRLLRASQI